MLADVRNWWNGDVVDFEYADNTTGFELYIVPNVVHFVRLGEEPLSLVDAICMRAASLQQRPDALMIHCDNCETVKVGAYWTLVKDIPGLVLRSIERPNNIFGLQFGWVEHVADVVRIKILMKYGGIYLDNDSYLVKSLDTYRRYEMSVGWCPGESAGNQVLVAHKNARYLKLWYDSYRYYRPDVWYWNAGILPTELFLTTWPHLIHRVPYGFGVHNLAGFLYEDCSETWTEYSAIHLLYRHRYYVAPSDHFGALELDNLGRYNTTFGQMARLVLFGTTKMGANKLKDNSWLRSNKLDYAEGVC